MEVDVIVVGSGQAGVPLATRLARAGRQVLLVERAALGGTCINYGCTPTKTMVASAQAAHTVRTSARLGVHADGVRVDLAAIVDRKNGIVKRWQEGIVRRLEAERARLARVQGTARFVGGGARELEVAGERHRAATVVLNVGVRPAVPAIPGLDGVPWLDNRRIMDLRELPSHLLVLGGGYIGCEFGQMFRRFGSAVTIVDRNRHLLAREDPEVSVALEQAFRDEGIELRLGAEIAAVARKGPQVTVRLDGQELVGSHLLVALGRRPNTDDLGCERAGIERDPHGFIVVDDLYRTSAEGVLAVGDAAGSPQFTHTAWDDHRLVFDLLMGQGSRGRSSRIIPHTVFTDPQVASVGMSEAEARARGVPFEAATLPFGRIARAIETDELAGVMKLLLSPSDERVLGATIVGAQAGELIHIFVTLMRSGASARAIVDAEFVHPTFAEGVQSLVMSLKRYALS